MQKSWGNQRSCCGQTTIDYQNRVVYKDNSIPSDYPATWGDLRFEYVSGAELHARRRKSGKDFAILQIHPATVEGTRIKVIVSQDWITVMKRKPGIAHSDWAVVFFRADSQTGQFRIDEVKLGGV